MEHAAGGAVAGVAAMMIQGGLRDHHCLSRYPQIGFDSTRLDLFKSKPSNHCATMAVLVFRIKSISWSAKTRRPNCKRLPFLDLRDGRHAGTPDAARQRNARVRSGLTRRPGEVGVVGGFRRFEGLVLAYIQ